jgi:threonine dehydrogenase-like Zn-dependent dehydrogenase
MGKKHTSNREKLKYFLLGVLLAVCLAFLAGASGDSFGRYQVSAWGGGSIGYGAFVVDTSTGETKMVYMNIGDERRNHLGKPFRAIE